LDLFIHLKNIYWRWLCTNVRISTGLSSYRYLVDRYMFFIAKIWRSRVENCRDKSRLVPPRFLHFTCSFLYFSDKLELVWNTGCQIRKRDGNSLACIPIVSVFLIFIGISRFTNSIYTNFTTMYVVVVINLLYILSVGLWVATIYIALLCVCGCKLVCEVLNYYHDLQLLVLVLFVYCFYVLMSGLLDDWVPYGSVYFHFDFP